MDDLTQPAAPDYSTEPCRSCGKPVIWAVTTGAKDMPVDAVPAAGGNVQLERRHDQKPLARVLSVAQQFGKAGRLRLSHFATCPHASGWRRRSRKDGS